MEFLSSDRIAVLRGDITKLEVDAIVNAANSQLLGGGGVDGAIHRAGGPEILEECKAIRKNQYPGPEGMPPGNAVVTSGGYLPAKKIIHTVGPVWGGGNMGEEAILEKAYLSCLETALTNKISSIAFPAISTGVFGYPKKKAAVTAYRTVKKFIESSRYPEMVYFVFINDQDADLFIKTIETVFFDDSLDED
ncbi:MAG: O-acetyl-ADP-ribose deacetylase [Spirochaetales bacterium]|nr:O-acetyl-ADP-ribose deacetylase [Spirochaetales bacterium]